MVDQARTLRRAALPLVAALLLSACLNAWGADRNDDMIAVGVGSTTEQQMLASLTIVTLQDAGLNVRLETDLGGTEGLRRSALRGTIDLFWDYTGAAWSLGRGEEAPPADPGESWERIRRADEASGLRWLAPTSANATLALFVRRQDLPPPDDQRGMTWLAQQLSTGDRGLCADPDFVERPGGLEALAAEYAIALDQLPTVPAAELEAIAAVAEGRCFAGLATATSGVAANTGLVPVADDLRVFPAFLVAPVVREGSNADRPEVVEALASVTELLDTQALARLNGRFEAGEEPEEIAEHFLAPDRGTPPP